MQDKQQDKQQDKRLGPVILDIAGHELQAEEKDILTHPKVGGLILFSRNYESTNQLFDLIRTIREVRRDLIVCVDHEGGRVQRFREGFTVLPTVQNLSLLFDISSDDAKHCATELGWLMSFELLSYDIDLSFAPVLDLDDNVSDIIGDRSFSADPNIAIELASAFIDGMHDAGMAATGKHFPGHGGVKADSHLELPVDPRSFDKLQAHDLKPFVTLHDKLDAVMSAHIAFPQVDSQLVSYSSFWLQEYLRNTVGYKGVIFSDDLSMEGAAGSGSYSQRAQEALLAGCDSVLVCNNPSGAIEVIQALEKERRFDKPTGLEKLSKRLIWQRQDLDENVRRHEAIKIVEQLFALK